MSKTSAEWRPLVSIIIVTYNAGQYLRGCLLSIVAQQYKNIEIIVFDGESTDNTVDTIREFDSHIAYWTSEPDKGIYDAMNKAVKKASGMWTLFLGADDRLLNGFSDMCAQLADDTTVYYGHCLIDNQPSNRKLSSYYVAKGNLCHQAIFYPTRVFKKYTYNIQYRVYADHALNIQLWGDKHFTKKYYDYAIAEYCTQGFSNRFTDEVFLKQQAALIRQFTNRYIYYRFLFRSWKRKRKK